MSKVWRRRADDGRGCEWKFCVGGDRIAMLGRVWIRHAMSLVALRGSEIRKGKRRRLIPLCYRRGGEVEQLLDLAPGLARSSLVEGQNWGNVLPTQSMNRASARANLEEDRSGLPIAKKKEPAGGGSLDLVEKRLKRSHDSSSHSSGEIDLPASHLVPWGESDPPSDRPALAASERWTFHHEKDIPFVSDPGACAELLRQIRGGMHLMPEIPKLTFPDRFVGSAQADMEAVFRKKQLISDYELALRGISSDFTRAEARIETKDVEIEKLKKAALEKSKEIVNERTRYFRERKQAKQTADDLE
ncbi:hypothetical protein Bca101_026407 [Brassica carinata]